MKRAIVTGANGFVGRHLVDSLLNAGVAVTGVVRCPGKTQRRDAKYAEASIDSCHAALQVVETVQPDAVFHLASSYRSDSPEDVTNLMQSNILLGTYLLDACSKREKKPVFVAAGTYWQFSEDGSIHPNGLYAATKQAFQDLLFYYRERMHLPAVALVLFDTYGPDDDRGKLWSSLLNSEPGARMQLTKGEQLIQLVHVQDVVDAFILAARLLETESLNFVYAVGTEELRTLRSIVEEFCGLIGREISFEWGARPYPPGTVFHPWRGTPLPGWTAKIKLADGVAHLLKERSRN